MRADFGSVHFWGAVGPQERRVSGHGKNKSKLSVAVSAEPFCLVGSLRANHRCRFGTPGRKNSCHPIRRNRADFERSERLFFAMLLSVFAAGSAMAQETCESKAV